MTHSPGANGPPSTETKIEAQLHLFPLYARSFPNKSELLQAWKAGQDFSVAYGGRCSRSDMSRLKAEGVDALILHCSYEADADFVRIPVITIGDSLRMIADWYDAHPDMPKPSESLSVYTWALEPSDIDFVRQIAKALGTFDKNISDTLFSLEKSFGLMTLKFVFWRDEICTPRVVGQKTVTTKKPSKPVDMIDVEETVDIIEWDCPPLLGHP